LLDLNISFKTAWGLTPDSQRHQSSIRLMRTVEEDVDCHSRTAQRMPCRGVENEVKTYKR